MKKEKKVKIFYKKESNNFAGLNFIEKININGQWKQELSDDNYDFIEIEESKWFEFQKENSEKQIYIENGILKAKEKKISLDKLKDKQINIRKNYLRETYEYWFDDVENMPKEIKDKRNLAKKQIKEIEKITKKEDLKQYENF